MNGTRGTAGAGEAVGMLLSNTSAAKYTAVGVLTLLFMVLAVLAVYWLLSKYIVRSGHFGLHYFVGFQDATLAVGSTWVQVRSELPISKLNNLFWIL